MLDLSIASYVRNAARRFRGDSQGNIAVIFAIALVPLLAFVGAAIDYTRANSARSAMQSALDSTALMLSKNLTDGAITEDQVQAKAQAYFSALYTNKDSVVDPTANIQATYTAKDASGASTILVTGSGYINTDFVKVASNNGSLDRFNFNTSATTTWGTARMRVAMVLDVTGSMSSDDKMPNLQTAAKSMVDTLSTLNKSDGDIYISLIPFSRDVNIGNGTAAAAWTTGWAAWEDEPASIKTTKPSNWKNYGPGAKCPFSGLSFGCVDSPVSGSNSTSTIPSSGTYSGYICPGVDSGTSNYYNGCYTSVYKNTSTDVTLCTGSGCKCSNTQINGTGAGTCACTGSKSSTVCKQTLRDYDHVWVANPHSMWNGCVVDRDKNYDTTNDAPTLGDTSKQFYVEQYSNCPTQPLTPMSNNWSTLKTTIGNLSPDGNTNQAIGAAWGWFSLSDTAPLSAPAKANNYTYYDYLVLVSDGLNTQNRWTTNQTTIDDRQKILCDNMKKSPYNVKIFAIQINTSTTKPDPESAVLKYCASGTDNFQMITSASQTAAAFQNVTTKLTNLRVSR
jgi:Flp pilus assembly protein TadG